MLSTFGTLPKDLRRIISQIPDGKVDDLGFATNLNPRKVNNELLELFKGVKSTKKMMERLAKNDHLKYLYDKAMADPTLQTQLFVNCAKKNFQPYI